MPEHFVASVYRGSARKAYVLIARSQVGPGNLAVDEGLLLRFVLGVEQPSGCGLVIGFETFHVVGLPVNDVEYTALAAEHPESLLHDFFHERQDVPFRNRALRSTAGAVILDTLSGTVASPLPPKLFLHTQLELEARVGIGRFCALFAGMIAIL
jgi:hypothetical protein